MTEQLHTFRVPILVEILADDEDEAREMLQSTSNWTEWAIDDREQHREYNVGTTLQTPVLESVKELSPEGDES